MSLTVFAGQLISIQTAKVANCAKDELATKLCEFHELHDSLNSWRFVVKKLFPGV